MRLIRFILDGHRSVEHVEFDASPFTVLFGKNNAGKTNILETISGIFAPDNKQAIRRSHTDRGSSPKGGAVVQLEPGTGFDDAVSAAVSQGLPTSWHGRVAFTGSGVHVGDPRDYEDPENREYEGPEDEDGENDFVEPSSWTSDVTDAPGLHVLRLDWSFEDLHERVELAMGGGRPWLEMIHTPEDVYAYCVPAAIETRLERLASLASDLLPDFVDGSISAHVTAATLWGRMPRVLLEYNQRGLTQCADLVDAAGQGTARWMSAAVQIALHLMKEYPDLSTLRDVSPGEFSRHVLLVDEPEAHLHPSAVESMVRWCHRMVRHGFTILVATHHEEFLRAAGEGVTLVHVTRDPDLVTSSARTLETTTTRRLQELAVDVGMHPAVALSLRRAILFVEGPLDEAVLDEFGGLELDAAGVKIIPIHGTKNLEGLVAVELVTGLGIKEGILTDATVVATMADRSGRKRSSEERKVLRVLDIAKEKNLPVPKAFGVPEDDLLFALPADGIRDYLKGPFPGWKELVAECRDELGKGPSDSVDWKSYALERYNLPINTTDGVRDLVRKLDLAGVELPSISLVIKEVVAWASQPAI